MRSDRPSDDAGRGGAGPVFIETSSKPGAASYPLVPGRVVIVNAQPRRVLDIGRGKGPASSLGMIVALIGPDGVGKSSQTARLTELFQPEFKCAAIYLGSGEGGWKFRRMAKQLFRKGRGQLRQPNSKKARITGKEFGTNHSVFTGLSGLLAAVERLVSMRRALRLARSGFVVLCDRWPQNLQPGLFDGPLRLSPHASWTVRMLSRLERSLYRRMEKFKPDLTIHLISDFETSSARKPGDRTREDFDQRLSIMQVMRALDPTIKVVDARSGFDEVTRELSNYISMALSERTGRPATAPKALDNSSRE